MEKATYLLVTAIIIIIYVGIGSIITIGLDHIYADRQYHYDSDRLSMINTISPIIGKLAEYACSFENAQIGRIDEWAKGGKLIYKREEVGSCISGVGNVYYIRCYEWRWFNDELWYKPSHDVSLRSFSCIDEDDIYLPLIDKELQEAELGKEYKVRF